jgi:hypothetical protein
MRLDPSGGHLTSRLSGAEYEAVTGHDLPVLAERTGPELGC